MGELKRSYIVVFLFLFLCGMLYFLHGKESIFTVEKSEAAAGREYFYPIISDRVNRKTTYYSMGQKTKKAHLFMSDERQIYIREDELSEALLCSVKFYDEEKLVIDRGDNHLELTKGIDGIRKGDITIACTQPVINQYGKYYVNLTAVTKALNISVDWDFVSNTAILMEESAASLPARFDLRDYGAVPQARNQGKLGTCWAFANLNALEVTLLPEEDMRFSIDHMSMQNSFYLSQKDGGEDNMAIAYLTAWQGPVLEQDDPYADGESPDQLEAVKHIQEVQMIEEKNYEKIKEAVYKYGGVSSSLYTSLKDSTSKSVYYNSKKSAYCYMGEDRPNHEVVIIGWDDNYPKENFNSPLEADGAFICLNSWGPRFGEDGVFYVSYYDTNIGLHNVVYTKAEDVNNYDSIYQTDLCGWVGNLGYGGETAFFANVYTAQKDETLEAVGFYATGKNTSYKVYFVPVFVGKASLAERRLSAEGTLENAGYYTIELDEAQAVKAEQKFAFVVEISTPNAIHPIAVEFSSGDNSSTRNVDISDGEGYISYHGSTWNSTEEEYKCNVCLKVYSKEIE